MIDPLVPQMIDETEEESQVLVAVDRFVHFPFVEKQNLRNELGMDLPIVVTVTMRFCGGQKERGMEAKEILFPPPPPRRRRRGRSSFHSLAIHHDDSLLTQRGGGLEQLVYLIIQIFFVLIGSGPKVVSTRTRVARHRKDRKLFFEFFPEAG
jgi:hypothetical protein